MTNFVPVNDIDLKGNEKKYINECIDSGWISSEGYFVEKFENAIAKNVQRKYAIAVSSGTAALDISIKAIGLKVSDEIIVPTFTIISCLNQIIRTGAKPILVDSDKDTWNIDINQIEKKITNRTKAIMIVHTYGLPANIDEILKLSKKYNLKIIEDSSEMLGQNYKNRPCGSFGDISTLSFYANKIVTTGEGGMILTNDFHLANKCKSLRNLCFEKDKRFEHEDLGWNYRMTNLQAAVGLGQLEKLEKSIMKKKYIGEYYNKKLRGLNKLTLPISKTSYAENIYWVYGIILDKSMGSSYKFIQKLKQHNIGSRPFFCPMHKQPIFKNMKIFDNELYPVADDLYHRGLYIPSGVGLSQQSIDRVIEVIYSLL